MDIHETFNDLRYHHEDEVVEFKKAENNFDFDDLGKYFSALSNEANLRDKAFAWIVFGVHDKSREVLGTSFKNNIKSLQKLKQDLSQHTTDNNTFREIHELKIDGKRVLMFQIPAAPRGIPMAWKGHFYGRRGESLVALDMSKYEEIRRQVTDVDWSKQIVEGATIDDLDEEAIAEARKGFKEHYPKLKKEVDGWSDEVFLNKAKLTIGGKITRTAILLLGKPESVHYLDHIGEIVWRLAGKDNVGQVFSIPFLLTTTEVMHKIRNYPFKIFPNESFLPGEGMKYDTETILEALHNCIAHQDYTQNARIIVIERENELEFTDLPRVIWKEIRTAVLCGLALAVLCFIKIMLIDHFIMGNESVTIMVAAVVCLTMAVTILCAKIVGCTLPLCAKKFGFDPAVMASPFITTIVDALSLLVYFGIAKALLGL